MKKAMTLMTSLILASGMTVAANDFDMTDATSRTLYEVIRDEAIKIAENDDVKTIWKVFTDEVKANYRAIENDIKESKNKKSDETIDVIVGKEFVSGDDIIVEVNGGVPTLTYSAFNTPKVYYSALDELNRAGQATAYLTKDNLVKSETRTSQRFKPTGWHNQNKIQNRGHLIAYTLTGNLDEKGNFKKGFGGSLDNPYNLFTQTEQANQKAMTQFEAQVRDALKAGDKVIYQVTPVFVGDELMARGAHLQAVSESGNLAFNVFIHNQQDGYRTDFNTGKSVKDKTFVVNN